MASGYAPTMETYENEQDNFGGGSLLEELCRIGKERGAGLLGPPALGADHHDTLSRARGVELKASQHQVDLNEAQHLAELEDAGLQEHMERARALLRESSQREEALPATAALRCSEQEARQALSAMAEGLSAQRTALLAAAEGGLLSARSARLLAEGGRPRGYPTERADSLSHLSGQVENAMAEVFAVAEALEGYARALTLARRASETAADGFARRAAHYEGVVSELGRL